MPSACANTRVIKTLSAHQPGAVKLARKHGSALVCVRHRHDAAGLIRYTTVELLVDEAPVRKRNADTELVHLRLRRTEFHLQLLVQNYGGQWDPTGRVWQLPRSTAKRLKLMHKVMAK